MLQAVMLQYEDYRLMEAMSRRWRDYRAAGLRSGAGADNRPRKAAEPLTWRNVERIR